MKATFIENGITCNYSSLLFADNANKTVKLEQSKAYSTQGDSACSEGKTYLDNLLAFNTYKYLHGRVAIYVPTTDSQALCSSDKVGIHLQVTGRVQ